MATSLRISSALALPIEAVTQRQAFLGKPGSGKSYAATLEAEQMYDAGAQFVALDPVGIWYGLRLDGKGKGIPIPVFGGLHGDIPLEALLKVYPESMDRGALAAESNQSVTSSGFEKNLSTLRTLGFIAYPSSSEAVATSLLRPRGLR